jgi:hypothetical protein
VASTTFLQHYFFYLWEPSWLTNSLRIQWKHLLCIVSGAALTLLLGCTSAAPSTQQSAQLQQAILQFPSNWQRLKAGMSPTEVSEALYIFGHQPIPISLFEQYSQLGRTMQMVSPDQVMTTANGIIYYKHVSYPAFELVL